MHTNTNQGGEPCPELQRKQQFNSDVRRASELLASGLNAVQAEHRLQIERHLRPQAARARINTAIRQEAS